VGRKRGDDRTAFLTAGLLCTLAVSSVLGLVDLRAPSLAPAVFLGIFFAIFAATGATVIASWTSAVCGGVGSVAALIELAGSAGCSGANMPLAFGWGALLVILAGLGWFAVSRNWHRNMLLTPLALFGALEVLGFYALPIGVSLDQTSSVPLAAGVSIAAAILFGALLGWRPDWALYLFGILLAVALLAVTTVYGTACAPGGSVWGIGAFAAYLIAYGIAHLIAGRRSHPER